MASVSKRSSPIFPAYVLGLAIAGLTVGYLFNWPRSIAGHHFLVPERGPLSEWIPGLIGLTAIIVALDHLTIARSAVNENNARFLQAKQVDEEREIARSRQASLDAAEKAIADALGFMVATLDLLAAERLPGGAFAGDGSGAVHRALGDRRRSNGRMQASGRVALGRLLAAGADRAVCHQLSSSFDAVLHQFGVLEGASEITLSDTYNQLAVAMAELLQRLYEQLSPPSEQAPGATS